MAEKNVYQMVADRIIAELEKVLIPWRKPWTGVRSGAYNRVPKKPYSLLNQMILKHDGEYATFKQWQDAGGKIRKGAKSEFVVFWKFLEKTETNENGEEVKMQIPMLRYYHVFHISDVIGVETLAVAGFGTEVYSKEELTAEIGSATLMSMLGIETTHTFRNSTAYIQNWLTVLRNDNKFVVFASGKAEKVVKYILGEE